MSVKTTCARVCVCVCVRACVWVCVCLKTTGGKLPLDHVAGRKQGATRPKTGGRSGNYKALVEENKNRRKSTSRCISSIRPPGFRTCLPQIFTFQVLGIANVNPVPFQQKKDWSINTILLNTNTHTLTTDVNKGDVTLMASYNPRFPNCGGDEGLESL